MTRQCAETGCRRDALPDSPDGTRHSLCAEDERAALSVFGERWHDQARENVLRPAAVGGTPITPAPAGEADSPLGFARSGGRRCLVANASS